MGNLIAGKIHFNAFTVIKLLRHDDLAALVIDANHYYSQIIIRSWKFLFAANSISLSLSLECTYFYLEIVLRNKDFMQDKLTLCSIGITNYAARSSMYYEFIDLSEELFIFSEKPLAGQYK